MAAAEQGPLPFKRDFSPSKVTNFGNRYRYFILGLGWLCLTSISSNMIALNFTLICMSPPVVVTKNDSTTTSNNSSAQMSDPEELQIHEDEGRNINKRHIRNNEAATKIEAVKWAQKYSVHSAAKKFNVDRRSVWEWKHKESALKQQVNNTARGSKRKCLDGGGRQVTNPEIDVLLAKWIREKRVNKQPVSRRIMSNKVGELFRGTDMKISIGWLNSFLKRHKFTRRRVTTTARKAPENYAEAVAKFIVHVEERKKAVNFGTILAMDETAVWFDCPDNACIETKGAKDQFSSITPSPNVNVELSLPKISSAPVFAYTAGNKAALMWAVAIGSMIGTFPFSWLYTRYGARYVLFGAGLLSAVATVLIPLAAVNGFNYFLVLRFLQGIAYSADFAAMGVLCSRWASLKQNALFISVLTCYSALSTAVTNPIAGLICESSYGWPMVYYGHAAVCVVLFMFWLYFYNDHPRVNRFVSDVELEKINRNKTHAHINMDKFIPYKAILTTRLVWVVWLNAFADLFSGMYLLMYQPSYFKYVLNYSIEQTGFLGALPSLSHMPLKFFFGWASDKIKCWPERKKLIIFNSVAVCLPGVCYAVVGFMPDDQPMLVVILFTLIHMLFSTAGGGFYKCGALCARQYSQFIIANIQFVKCLTLFVGPALMAIFVSDETDKTQWRNIFISLAVMLFFANVLFCREATDEPSKFTEITAESWKRKKLEKNSTAKGKLEQKA